MLDVASAAKSVLRPTRIGECLRKVFLQESCWGFFRKWSIWTLAQVPSGQLYSDSVQVSLLNNTRVSWQCVLVADGAVLQKRFGASLPRLAGLAGMVFGGLGMSGKVLETPCCNHHQRNCPSREASTLGTTPSHNMHQTCLLKKKTPRLRLNFFSSSGNKKVTIQT